MPHCLMLMPIEPSSVGGEKLARAIVEALSPTGA
jgi:hypothetical protein